MVMWHGHVTMWYAYEYPITMNNVEITSNQERAGISTCFVQSLNTWKCIDEHFSEWQNNSHANLSNLCVLKAKWTTGPVTIIEIAFSTIQLIFFSRSDKNIFQNLKSKLNYEFNWIITPTWEAAVFSNLIGQLDLWQPMKSCLTNLLSVSSPNSKTRKRKRSYELPCFLEFYNHYFSFKYSRWLTMHK